MLASNENLVCQFQELMGSKSRADCVASVCEKSLDVWNINLQNCSFFRRRKEIKKQFHAANKFFLIIRKVLNILKLRTNMNVLEIKTPIPWCFKLICRVNKKKKKYHPRASSAGHYRRFITHVWIMWKLKY